MLKDHPVLQRKGCELQVLLRNESAKQTFYRFHRAGEYPSEIPPQ